MKLLVGLVLFGGLKWNPEGRVDSLRLRVITLITLYALRIAILAIRKRCVHSPDSIVDCTRISKLWPRAGGFLLLIFCLRLIVLVLFCFKINIRSLLSLIINDYLTLVEYEWDLREKLLEGSIFWRASP